MEFQKPLLQGTLLKRYKRFLADVMLADGSIVTAHCPNSGSMKGLVTPQNPVVLTFHDDPKRKLPYTLQAICVNGTWVGVNTNLPNALVAEAIACKQIVALAKYTSLKREVKYAQNSRIDLLLKGEGLPDCYVEVKNVTLREDKRALFPDAVTTRGQKHLMALSEMVQQGYRAVMFYLVQRGDCLKAGVAKHIDPHYDELLKKAMQCGVDVLCYACDVTPQGVEISKKIPFEIE